jgi:1,4-alpha-glucan branching enzyme
MASLGAFTFVLHSHLPYARLAGRWPHGEEWIHEAASETYIPLLDALYELRAEGIKFKLTIGITPVLCEQLADADVCDHLDEYLDEKIARAKKDVLRFRGDLWEQEQAAAKAKSVAREDAEDPKLPKIDRKEVARAKAASDKAKATAKAELVQPEKPWWVGDKHLEYLATFYQEFYEHVKEAFDTTYKRDIVGAFKVLQDEGYIEIITCAATHGYLPLLGDDSAIRGQLRTGIASYERLFGRKPRAIWLPECAYRPAYYSEDGKLRPGIEYFLREAGIKLFFSETHLITGGAPVGVAAGEAIGPYGDIKRRYLVPMSSVPHPGFETTTFNPYYVSDTTSGPVSEEHSGVSIIGRNNETGQRVWSADWGYPGDFDYREFHRKDGESGMQYWRVTGPKVDLGDKDFYHPDWAENKVRMHAADFVGLVERIHQARHDSGVGYGLIASNYDTELFGHWWFEGIDWIKAVLRGLAESDTVDLVTASGYIEKNPPQEVLHVPEGSWGMGGNHFTWSNIETDWMWPPLYDAEARLKALAIKHGKDWNDKSISGVLNQAARELLLAESSDWPFLVTTGQARDYAVQRFSEHLERFIALIESVENGQPDGALAASLWEKDRLFENIDFRWWNGD